ncbi:MAG: hypothetical protein FWD73_14755 [Polyangiaceae bacterium]|nr:hypothetical protein [Polyangiaceae bacterium]
MSTQESPYREEDAEARARLDAKQRKERAKQERRQRKELAEQAKLRELSRHALENENTPENASRRRIGLVAAARTGAVIGAILGGVGAWVADDWLVLVAAPFVGVIFSVWFVSVSNKSGELPRG